LNISLSGSWISSLSRNPLPNNTILSHHQIGNHVDPVSGHG
jgi:hypothetical protein